MVNHLTKEQYKYVTMASGTQYVVEHMLTDILVQQFAINLDLLQVVVSYILRKHNIFITQCTMYIVVCSTLRIIINLVFGDPNFTHY